MNVSRHMELARRWDESSQISELLSCLQHVSSQRKFRLVLAAAIRRLSALLLDPRSQQAVTLVERLAEGDSNEEELRAGCLAAYDAYIESRANGFDPALANAAYCLTLLSTQHPALQVAWSIFEDCRDACERNRHLGFDPQQEQQAHSQLLRCVFPGPLPVALSEVEIWRRWNEGTIVRLAQTIYENGQYHDLPVLGDALEEAGCAEERILQHCHGKGLHVRGCWVLDWILGKE